MSNFILIFSCLIVAIAFLYLIIRMRINKKAQFDKQKNLQETDIDQDLFAYHNLLECRAFDSYADCAEWVSKINSWDISIGEKLVEELKTDNLLIARKNHKGFKFDDALNIEEYSLSFILIYGKKALSDLQVTSKLL